MITQTQEKTFRVRSYVCRNSRRSPAQQRAYTTLQPLFSLSLANGMVDYAAAFKRIAPCFLEIGFGSGQSLLALAKAHPKHNFIGIETHRPGIGALLIGIKQEDLTNIRLFEADAVEVLHQCIPDNSLTGINIFFPDPWPKRRHHGRRLIQPEFVRLLISKLVSAGKLDLATDWEDYALHMLEVLQAEKQLTNLAASGKFASRSTQRPILTKFERRALREGRSVWELQFQKP